jgi:hypothetical protein
VCLGFKHLCELLGEIRKVDALIVQTLTQVEEEKRFSDMRVFALPHQHTNLWGMQHPDPAQPVRTVGFLFSEHNRLDHDLEMFMAHECEKLGVRFYLLSVDYQSCVLPLSKSLREGHACDLPWHYPPREDLPENTAVGGPYKCEEPWDQYPHHKMAEGIDIAFVWPPHTNPDYYTQNLRPPTRLIFWWSHGVPTIYFPYKSYDEVADLTDYPIPSVLTKVRLL